jgi:hypothetical protein
MISPSPNWSSSRALTLEERFLMRPVQSLQTKLDAYKALSSDDRTTDKGRQRSWALYATAAGSGLALVTAAEAGIMYSGIQNVTAAPGTNAESAIHINIGGGNPFVIDARRGTGAFSTLGDASLRAVAGGGMVMKNVSSQLLRLASGAKISSHAGSFRTRGNLQYKKHSTFSNQQNGTWPQGQQGFAGVEFTQGGQDHFGWIRLSWNGDNSGFPTSLTAIDWAYNDVAGASILAGQETSGAVPEPNSAVLALLGTGCAGVLAWRRRKRPGSVNAQAGRESQS